MPKVKHKSNLRPLRDHEIVGLLDDSDDDLPEIEVEEEEEPRDDRVQVEIVTRHLPVFIDNTVSFFIGRYR